MEILFKMSSFPSPSKKCAFIRHAGPLLVFETQTPSSNCFPIPFRRSFLDRNRRERRVQGTSPIPAPNRLLISIFGNGKAYPSPVGLPLGELEAKLAQTIACRILEPSCTSAKRVSSRVTGAPYPGDRFEGAKKSCTEKCRFKGKQLTQEQF